MLFGNEISFLVSDPGLKNYSTFFISFFFVSEFLLDSAKNRLIEYYQSRTASDSFISNGLLTYIRLEKFHFQSTAKMKSRNGYDLRVRKSQFR